MPYHSIRCIVLASTTALHREVVCYIFWKATDSGLDVTEVFAGRPNTVLVDPQDGGTWRAIRQVAVCLQPFGRGPIFPCWWDSYCSLCRLLLSVGRSGMVRCLSPWRWRRWSRCTSRIVGGVSGTKIASLASLLKLAPYTRSGRI